MIRLLIAKAAVLTWAGGDFRGWTGI